MSEPFLGQVIAVGFAFVPRGWLPCDGRLVSISTYQDLFALVGTTYGGDGVQSFGLPDLRGRGAVGAGQGPGLQAYIQGQFGGSESVSLTANQIGAHTHSLAAAATATTNGPAQSAVLGTPASEEIYATAGTTTTLMPATVGVSSGGGQSHENRQPFQAINYIIAYEGVYPPRG